MSMYKCVFLFVANVWVKLEQEKLREGIQELLLIFAILYNFEFFVKLKANLLYQGSLSVSILLCLVSSWCLQTGPSSLSEIVPSQMKEVCEQNVSQRSL